MSQALTKEYFDQKLGGIDGKLEGMETRLTESIRGLNTNFIKSQGTQNERHDRVDEKLVSIGEDVRKIKFVVVDLMGTDRHMHNLVRELQGKGIQLEESKIFTNSVTP